MPRQSFLVRLDVAAARCDQIGQFHFARSHRFAMMNQALVPLPLRRDREPELVEFFRGFLLAQTRALASLFGRNLEGLLVLEITAVRLQFTVERRDAVFRVRHLLFESLLLRFELR